MTEERRIPLPILIELPFAIGKFQNDYDEATAKGLTWHVALKKRF
jgi:hypothetical protein